MEQIQNEESKGTGQKASNKKKGGKIRSERMNGEKDRTKGAQ
jgi:hypothetical protein